MGRVKGTLIKRVSRELITKYPDKFTSDFEKNKKIMGKILTTYKRFRNSIAGYVARLIKRQEKKKEAMSKLDVKS
jgi:small subunit ribosomal protein S17e